jgi:uncharacterized protein YjbI with pentapeptide repeats
MEERSLTGMFNHCTVEVLSMRWIKREMWKAGITIASMLLLLVLMVWVPVSAASADERASGLATPVAGMVQATPTEDATVTTLNKEQLTLQVKQLQNQNNWLANNSTAFIAAFTTLVVTLFGISQWAVNRRDERRKEITVQNKELEDRQAERERREEEQKRWLEDRQAERERRAEEQQRWLKDQEAEREKRVEERFQSAVTGLGDEKEGARIGAAILLRTFLRPGYERFYTQIFQLVAANLRLPRTPNPPEDPAAPLPLTALSQALMTAFMEAFPLAREQEQKNVETKLADNEYKVRSTHPAPVAISSKEIHSLNAINILLDNGFLWYADLKQVWMAQASLRKTDLTGADLSEANLYAANLSEAYLWETNLSGANLWQANLCKADLRGTNLSGANLLEANLSGANLYRRVKLSGVVLSKANLSGAELSGTNLEEARSLEQTDLRGVKGLTKEQLEACKAQGAIIDEDFTVSPPQSSVSPSPPSQSNDA